MTGQEILDWYHNNTCEPAFWFEDGYLWEYDIAFTEDEVKFMCDAITYFGGADHPVAIPSTLDDFGIDYTLYCVIDGMSQGACLNMDMFCNVVSKLMQQAMWD